MSTVAIVLIVVGVLILIGLVVLAVRRRARDLQLDDRRQEAEAHRAEAAARRLIAERERQTAEAHRQYADQVDPDLDSSETEPTEIETSRVRES